MTEVSLMPHVPVLLSEVITYLNIEDNKHYLDCTFGAGGYTRRILEANNSCQVTAIDMDFTVNRYAQSIKQKFGNRFHFINSNFADIFTIEDNIKYDGVVLDLGVSSMQIDDSHRGFSFMKNGSLDMRMSQKGISAYDLVNNFSEKELARIIYEYGEEEFGNKVAKAIVNNRKNKAIRTTCELSKIVDEAIPYRRNYKIHIATKVFQAIRIFVNDELNSINKFLNLIHKILAHNAHVVVVSFHSLEDRIFKQFFHHHARKRISISKYAKNRNITYEADQFFEIITQKPITPTREEIATNVRARSAKMRVAKFVGVDI